MLLTSSGKITNNRINSFCQWRVYGSVPSAVVGQNL